jgi:DNA-binding response OmpR family regulator
MTTKPVPTYRFRVFELDLRSGELRKNGSKLKIQEQSLQVLALLLAHPGEPVSVMSCAINSGLPIRSLILTTASTLR